VEVKESEDDLVATLKFGVDELQKASQANHDSMTGGQPVEHKNVSPFKTPMFNNAAPQLDIVMEKIEEEKEKIL
jgi:hypothetical protein